MKFHKATEMPYPENWPPKRFHAIHSEITIDQAKKLEKLIEKKVDETQIDKFLRNNKNILVNCLRPLSTGHHSAWVIPQQEIRPSMSGNHRGLIPDYILGGKSSDGFEWFVLELKGVGHKLFIRSGKLLYLSSVANKAICQIMEYIDYCASCQSYLRDTLKLTDFREPKGLILIGREEEFSSDPRSQSLKAAWNRYLGNKIEIRSYDSLLRYVKSEIKLKQERINR